MGLCSREIARKRATIIAIYYSEGFAAASPG
jgi:hypothetical protein